ncbi:XdhC family protein [Desulfitobacterium sp.]|uniref:XdhC family protein n=1 Tax=Desulfitobacterium sp. TaxID=49981 RepID=UPI002BE43063|nr:XdhC family protein [Desulfitobacterium sp.]HVJ50249.1 XdhC family protein [Desulfitobacterium sp.]
MQRIYDKLNEMLENHQIGASGVVIEGDPALCPTGTKFLVNDAGELLAGNLNKNVLNSLQEDLLMSMRSKKPMTLTVAGGLKIFLNPLYPPTRLLILGGGHIALPLVKLGRLMDFQVTVVDDRPSFANPVRFGEADEVICESFETVFPRVCIDQNTYVVIVTRGHRYDQLCVEAVLNTPVQPAYIGMIGSRRKVAAIMDALKENGTPEELLNKVYAPIGLDIGAQTPEEIALSILAEIIMVEHYGKSNGLGTQARGKKSNG